MLVSPSAAMDLWRACYCDRDLRFGDCARYRLYREGKPISAGLLPSGKKLSVIPLQP